MLRAVSPMSDADSVSPGDGVVEQAEGEPEEVVRVASEESEEPPPPPQPHPAGRRPRPRPGKRVTVDEPAAVENKGVLVGKAQLPVPLTDVKVPSPAEVARHNLTHLPYKRWCRFCVAARCPNLPHLQLPPFSRKHPLLVLD